MKDKGKVKIIVAMSGGVDSSMVAALLQKRGYDVVGVYLRLINHLDTKCPKIKRTFRVQEKNTDEKSARGVAKKLGIKLEIIDARKKFKKTIVDYFLREYKVGRTPNPCAICNPKIKFAQIIKMADKLGIKYVATGHYAKIFPHPAFAHAQSTLSLRERGLGREGFKLFEAKDKTKDQSYFLYGLSQAQLSRIIFPLGKYKKPQVRAIAKKMKLPVFDRKESHDICFISGKAEDYLRKNLKLKKGKIVDAKNKILGVHQGLPLYTIGQRKGIKLGGVGPYYVSEKNTAKNKLIVVSKSDNPKLFKKEMLIRKVNWIAENLKFPLKVNARIRYGHPAVCAIIKLYQKKYRVIFKEPQRAITPGQSAVFYGKNGEVLGGGIIS